MSSLLSHLTRLILLPALIIVSLATITALPLHAAESPAMVLENGGLKHTYRVIFRQFDEGNEFASGTVEVYSQDDEDTPVSRLPFAAVLKKDPKAKNTELLEIRGTGLLTFFPPANRKEPYPPLAAWKLIGRHSGKARLKATLWQFDADKNTWAAVESEFEEVARK